ncbi:Alpha,alpha-trehalase [Pseudoxanthomonas suwonensis 11-1]|uniref:Periplasmic trehalase n=1 Tax=Pseudoxanthomonas suwonensis (strain 11-1) TaxID=743721 RepID=E6WW24_PSEUU|nr:alpha,alpha-trehalase TreA [Pseudoxanthomonas suwonensis]ADV28515.1 Alpha,alpha-trehalase [Pseudoxanthomonas suwonensis 11-1]
MPRHPARRFLFVLPLLLGACAAQPPVAHRPAQVQPAVVADTRAVRTPDRAWPNVFAAVQEAQLFEDQKFFVDAVPRSDPATVEAAYARDHVAPGFDLGAFVERHFVLPAAAAGTDIPRRDSLRAHIDALWPLLTRRSPEPLPHDSLLPLPQPYVVPGGRFREVYYWDSYFTMLGLAESGQHALVGQMLDNFAHLIDRWGHIPNGNRSYYLSRSQPPFFSHMVELEARADPAVATRYLAQLRREHAFWMDGAEGLRPGQAHRRVVRLEDGSLLNRYWDDRDTPRPESYIQDRETAAASNRPAAEVYRELRAGAESGWDFSSRWLDDPMRLDTIHVTSRVPVDLNSLLHHLETTIAGACEQAGDAACARDYTARAQARAAAIERHLWSEDGYYGDLDLRDGKVRAQLTAATLFPLHAGIASPERASRTAAAVRAQLLKPGGLLTTAIDSGQQWDAPNVWAPLQWIAVDGLRRYGDDALAREIAAAFVGNVRTLFEREHKLVEKYDADGALQGGGGGEYPLQDGFGWSNGVALALMALYPGLGETPVSIHEGPARRTEDTPAQ